MDDLLQQFESLFEAPKGMAEACQRTHQIRLLSGMAPVKV
jgi:hypothetical protein